LTQIVTNLSQASLANAAKGNLYAFFRQFMHSTCVEFNEQRTSIRWRTAIPHPWFNGVLSSIPPTRDESHHIQATVAYFQEHQVAGFTWWLEPKLKLAPWMEALGPSGFAYADDTPGMARDLSALPRDSQHPSQAIIRQVQDLETLSEWTHTFILGYQLPAEVEKPFYELLVSFGFELPFRHYIGYLYGKPVATSTLFLGAGVAGLYNIATIPEARGQGIGAALTLHPLHQALNLGYRIGVLQSSEMGYRVYQRLGFQTVCKIDHFYWPAV
jgi:ribosomal protein S18 acetylase RimI-like enzyme